MPLKAGAVTSSIHVTVLPTEDVLPHPSVAVNLLSCDLLQPVLVIAPSVCERVGVPHASVAVAVPRAVVIADDVGLHPKFCVVYVPVKVGGALSSIQVSVRDVVAVLLQASLAVNILVIE